MRRPNLLLPLLTLLLLGGASAGCPNEALGPGTQPAHRRQPASKTSTDPAEVVSKRAMETICDRMEDCAIERNVALARGYGGNTADLEAARLQARIALHSGYVRRWCLMRLSRRAQPELMQIHKCLARTSCEPFYRCAQQTQSAGAHSRARPSARLPK